MLLYTILWVYLLNWKRLRNLSFAPRSHAHGLFSAFATLSATFIMAWRLTYNCTALLKCLDDISSHVEHAIIVTQKRLGDIFTWKRWFWRSWIFYFDIVPNAKRAGSTYHLNYCSSIYDGFHRLLHWLRYAFIDYLWWFIDCKIPRYALTAKWYKYTYLLSNAHVEISISILHYFCYAYSIEE